MAFEIDVGRERENVERKRFHVNAGGERKRGEKVGRVIWCGGCMKDWTHVI